MSLIIPGKLVYLEHPRSASVATEAALSEAFDTAIVTPDHHRVLEDFSNYNGELVCCTIRNPFDILASWFVLSGRTSMLDFLANYTHSEMQKNGLLYYHKRDADVCLMYGDLEAELNSLLAELDLSPVVIPRLNVTPNKKPFMSYFNDVGCLALMERRFGAELLEAWPESI